MTRLFLPRAGRRAILHIDGDAFFAAVEQARDPALKGKPVVTGRERGIAASMSYEAKARGLTRGMPIGQIRKVCPDAVILPSDYESYSLLSKRFFEIGRRFTPDVEEYSIDECFADLTGLRRSLRGKYDDIAQRIKRTLDTELGFTFSVGLAPSKVLAKIGSKFKKPSGLTVIKNRYREIFLRDWPAADVWGIGAQTTALLAKHGMHTALDVARSPYEWVQKHLTKPGKQIWMELNGISVMPVDTSVKSSYATVQKFKTFSPSSRRQTWVFAQLSKNIEGACIKARRYKLAASGALFILRTQSFEHRALEVWFDRPTAFSHRIVRELRQIWPSIWRPDTYRATGAVLLELTDDGREQADLFGGWRDEERMMRIYESIDALHDKYGKYAVFLGSSFLAQVRPRHAGDRGSDPERTRRSFVGETRRRRVNIPMLTGVQT
jgi:DNA polymerase-4/DNA polymerase V